MADLMFGQGDSQTPMITQPPMVDIGPLIDNVGQRPTTGAVTMQTLPGEVFSNDAIMAQMQAAITAVSTAASKSYHGYKSPDTAKYLDAAERVRTIGATSVEDIDSQRTKYTAATNQEKQAIQDAGLATMQKTAADQAKAQKIADINYAVNREFGVAGNDDRLADKIGTFHMLNDRYLNMESVNERLKDSVAADAARLREETSIGFTDDPLRWIEGIFTIPQLNDTVEAGNAQINVMNNKLAGLGAAVELVQRDINETVSASISAKEARAGTIPSITAQQAVATNNLTAAIATEKAAEADQKLTVQSAAFAGQKFAQVVTSTNTEHSVAVLQQQNAELAWRSGVQALAKADSDAKAKLAIVDMMTKINDSQQMVGILKLAEARLGYPEGSLTLSRYRAMPDKMKEGVIGQAMGYVGATPGDAYFNLKELADGGIRPGPGYPEQAARMLRAANADLERFQSAQVVKDKMAGMNKDQQKAFLKEHINERYAAFQRSPATDAAENPYYEQSPMQVAAAVPQLAETKVGKILQPLITGVNAPNTDQVLAAIRAGAADVKEAALMTSQYYRLNMQVRNRVVDFQGMGLKPVTSYFYRAPNTGSFFGSNLRVDLTNITEVENMYRRQDIRQDPRGAAAGVQF